ncbi:Alkyltransferase-like protein 1 OS=Schizosaccharomyces pombe (strain 972 / ATCC 24843) GN=atl1 PE=1 SV=1 [Rhizoctonia solani AG-1 IB]|uniref:Alkyltransferase-like protein 1 n=1 Tax=Thanatephorus cucumeris (strain AG1-IB / isolate 7/3/14) TaxID=1108050 RepID=A0A0B7FLU8_THACB|nr:Alkyltransferase-like protein 1 OS=Schizosaccharomyces pombe (strain 972 / ATCC 24843) GN=atl1 PE=1 SV=1 [Rhizoctonia solani AG-1 IB]
MDAAEFHARVYAAVRQIPMERVTSYGHIAKIAGMPRYSRHVGKALKFLPGDSDIPWHRVIASNGTISSRGPGTTGADRQRQALQAEGVEVNLSTLGRGLMRVNLSEYGWFPDPSEVELDVENV